jgi:sugar lactone lactonase YvrE
VTREITTILKDLSYLEGPRWHDGRIWVADFYTHQVLSAREDGSDLRVEAEVPNQPSGLGWLVDGRLLVASMRDRTLLRRETDGTLVTHADLGDHVGGHLNDMVVDTQGRAFLGNFGFDLMGGAPIEPANLLRIDPDGTVTEVADDLLFPNGSAITDDDILLVGETLGNQITAFDITSQGTLERRRAWASFGERPTERDLEGALAQVRVGPDGCCLDAEGALWIADAVNGRLIRVREGGDIIEEIVPGTGVFACMLGGRDGRTLFACAAPDFQEDNRKNAREASLLAIRVDVPRAGLP